MTLYMLRRAVGYRVYIWGNWRRRENNFPLCLLLIGPAGWKCPRGYGTILSPRFGCGRYSKDITQYSLRIHEEIRLQKVSRNLLLAPGQINCNTRNSTHCFLKLENFRLWHDRASSDDIFALYRHWYQIICALNDLFRYPVQCRTAKKDKQWIPESGIDVSYQVPKLELMLASQKLRLFSLSFRKNVSMSYLYRYVIWSSDSEACSSIFTCMCPRVSEELSLSSPFSKISRSIHSKKRLKCDRMIMKMTYHGNALLQ